MEKESGEQELWPTTLEEGLLTEGKRRHCYLRAGEEEPPGRQGSTEAEGKGKKPALHRRCY